MVTLKRFGCFGNGASVGMLARFFRNSEGTVELYTNRLKGLRLRLQDDDDAQRIIARIRSCAVLHNLLLSEDFDWVVIDVDEDGDEQDEE
ncbi:hypothetical protein PsorP6_005574 [Peronosclerospora sorghi]|uniref:Uncharacterized protein n=1 Tax=Peronosclerospora sorghi TaxID=230839 RepID=A0ACC0W3P2_9STRA|nr:hypothetical protein PsorP6_005574 [Peronosclerospora sorghi]